MSIIKIARKVAIVLVRSGRDTLIYRFDENAREWSVTLATNDDKWSQRDEIAYIVIPQHIATEEKTVELDTLNKLTTAYITARNELASFRGAQKIDLHIEAKRGSGMYDTVLQMTGSLRNAIEVQLVKARDKAQAELLAVCPTLTLPTPQVFDEDFYTKESTIEEMLDD